MQVSLTEKIQCKHCGSTMVDLVDHDTRDKSVTKINCICRKCGKEFEHHGALSQKDRNRIRLRTAVWTWCTYFASSMVLYAVIS